MIRAILPLLLSAACTGNCTAEPTAPSVPAERNACFVFVAPHMRLSPAGEEDANDPFAGEATVPAGWKPILFDRVLPTLGPGLPVDCRAVFQAHNIEFRPEDLALYYPPHVFIRGSQALVDEVEMISGVWLDPSQPGTEVTLRLSRTQNERTQELVNRTILCRRGTTRFERKRDGKALETISLEVWSADDGISVDVQTNARFSLAGGVWEYKGATLLKSTNPGDSLLFQAPDADGKGVVELKMRVRVLRGIVPKCYLTTDGELAVMAGKINEELSRPPVPCGEPVPLLIRWPIFWHDKESLLPGTAPASLGGGRLYDLRNTLIKAGVPLEKDDIAIYADVSQLACIRAARPGVADPGFLRILFPALEQVSPQYKLLTQLHSASFAGEKRHEFPLRILRGAKASIRADDESLEVEASWNETIRDFSLVLKDLRMGKDTWSYDGSALTRVEETTPLRLVTGILHGHKGHELSVSPALEKTAWELLEENPEQARAAAEELLRAAR